MIAQLYQSINQLSNEVETLLEAEDEESCTELLHQRQSLLEQLAIQVASMSNSQDKEQENHNYLVFLRSIQIRDNKYLQYVQQQKQVLLSQSSQQVKTNKAIKAYHNLL